MPGRRVSQSKKTMPDSSGYSLHPVPANTQREIVSPNPAGSCGKSRCLRDSAFQVGAGIRKTRSGPVTTKRYTPKRTIAATKRIEKLHFIIRESVIRLLENKSAFEIQTRQIVRKGMVYDRLFPVCETCRFLPSGIAVFRPLRRFPVRQIGFRLMRFSAFSSVPFPI